MAAQFLVHNWALVIASVLGAFVLLFVVYRLYRNSARGRLKRHVALLRRRHADSRRAQARLERSRKRLQRLRLKSDRTRPRTLSEAEEAVQDAESLQKIADDQVLRAQKLVREVIVEEFPPNRHDGLRLKYM